MGGLLSHAGDTWREAGGYHTAVITHFIVVNYHKLLTFKHRICMHNLPRYTIRYFLGPYSSTDPHKASP